jgi:hypothetical protein
MDDCAGEAEVVTARASGTASATRNEATRTRFMAWFRSIFDFRV